MRHIGVSCRSSDSRSTGDGSYKVKEAGQALGVVLHCFRVLRLMGLCGKHVCARLGGSGIGRYLIIFGSVSSLLVRIVLRSLVSAVITVDATLMVISDYALRYAVSREI